MDLIAEFDIKVKVFAQDNYRGECWRAYMEMEIPPFAPITSTLYLGVVRNEYGLIISEVGLPELLDRLKQEYPELQFI